MNVYTCTDFTGHWPVGVAAVVIANDKNHASNLLNEELKRQYLKGDSIPGSFSKLCDTSRNIPQVLILRDGNY